MKILNVPYIGIKIESLPTILKVLNESTTDADFINYFIKRGKKKKTATEYLASLRNLKLAFRDENNQTKINNNGIYLINDDVDYLYKNLYKHIKKNFPDIKHLRDIIKEDNPKSLDELKKFMDIKDYKVPREATLSSYFKILNEAEIRDSISKKGPDIRNGDVIELNQFYKILINLMDYDRIVKFEDLLKYLDLKKSKKNLFYNIPLITNYMKKLQNERKIKLYEVSAIVGQNHYNVLKIDSNYYYYLEVLDNAT